MKISLNWLKRYVDINVPLEELCNKMIMSGFEVDGVEDLSASMDKVVAARILKIEKHPDSDHLLICQMDVGEAEPVQIITGADNVFEGALVPAALHGSTLPNGMHIKKGKLRGLPSNGMLCSGGELCLKEADYPGAEVNGILILHEDCPAGTDMRKILGLFDTIIDFDVTANRPDCQSVMGMAREVAVALKVPFTAPVNKFSAKGGNVNDEISVEVRDYELCPRYIGRVVKNLRIAPSPEWMKECLRAAGMRPINNIVDITNFVMLETGHPMHAFDLDRVIDKKIIVRRASEGEKITTLDGKDHTLTSEMLVIADGKNPSCLAGIMGGEESEITENTTSLFLECAKFKRDNIRRTGRSLGMRTESSGRFEKGVDLMGTAYAMDRALSLIEEFDAGDIVEGVIDQHEELPAETVIRVTAESICSLLGVDIPEETMIDILNSLQIRTVKEGNELVCTVPYFRGDIEGRADLAEEVMRVYGYIHIVGTPMRGDIIRGRKLPERIHTDEVKALLTSCGAREISTYSFISGKAFDMLDLPADDERRKAITLINPLGEEYSVMRTQLASSMLTVLSTNMNRKIPSARFFEVSKLFLPKQLPVTEQPVEAPALSIGLYGEEEDFYTLKGIIEAIDEKFCLGGEYVRSKEPFLHPGRQANLVSADGAVLAVFGEVHPDVCRKFGLEGRVYFAEMPLTPLFKAAEKRRTLYQPLPRFPASTRDLAFLCDDDLPVAELEKAIRKGAGRIVSSIRLFDVYRGKQVAEGKKSVAFALELRAPDRTLTDEEADKAMAGAVKAVEELGGELRG